MLQHECTLADTVEFRGAGLHTGEIATMRILPAGPGTGIIFRRVDLDDFEIAADVASVARVAYATTLMQRGVWISTVEHVLSALYGMGVDNACVELDNFEVPILDGSAAPYTDAIRAVGLRSQKRVRDYIRIMKPFRLEENGKSLAIYPHDRFAVQYSISFPPPVGDQSIDVTLSSDAYASSLATARTFCYYRDIEALQANGLIRGGSLENAIVLTETGTLNDVPLRFPDEFVRHKALDLLGDFALIGKPVLGKLVADRAGHALHTRFVAGLLDSAESWVLSQVDSETTVASA